MRRGDRGTGQALREQRRRLPEQGQRIGVVDGRQPRAQNGQHLLARADARLAETGPDHHGVDPTIREHVGEGPGIAMGGDNRAVEGHAVERRGRMRRGDRDHAGPRPLRPPRGQPRRPQHLRAARHQQMAAAVLVHRRIGGRQRSAPQGRPVQRRLRRDIVENRGGNADVRQDQRPASRPPRQQIVPGLRPEEGDRRRRARGPAARRLGEIGPAVADDAAGHVDGDQRHRRRVRRRQDGGRRAFRRTVEPRAEQRVHDDVGALDQGRIERLDRPGPPSRRRRGVPLQPIGASEEPQTHMPAAFGQQAGRDESVAAVVPGAAEDRGRAGFDPRANGIGHGRAGGLHQVDARDAGRDRRRVGIVHLARRQQSRVVPGALVHPRRPPSRSRRRGAGPGRPGSWQERAGDPSGTPARQAVERPPLRERRQSSATAAR